MVGMVEDAPESQDHPRHIELKPTAAYVRLCKGTLLLRKGQRSRLKVEVPAFGWTFKSLELAMQVG